MCRQVKFVALCLCLIAHAGISTAGSPPDLVAVIPPHASVADARDVAVDSSGNMYVLIAGGSYATLFEGLIKVLPSGQVEWSTTGGPGPDQEFNDPQGVAVDGSGRVYVVERGAHRVQYFRTSDGGFLGEFGSECFLASSLYGDCVDPDGDGPLELGDGQFSQPTDIATDASGRIYVADFANHRIQVFSGPGQFLFKFGSFCSLDPTDPTLYGVGCIDPDGAGPLDLGDGQFDFPSGVDVAPDGTIAVADSGFPGNKRIEYFDSNGNFLLKASIVRAADKVQFDPTGNLLFVAANFAGATYDGIEVLDRTGASINSFATTCYEPDYPCGPGDVLGISGMGLSSAGDLLVVDADGFRDRRNMNIEVYSVAGQYLSSIGNFGESPLLQGATGVDVDDSGNVYVVGGGLNTTIREYASDGTFVREISAQQFADDIAVDNSASSGTRLIVSNESSDRVSILDSNGQQIGVVGTAGSKRCILSTGTDCVDPDGAGPLQPGDGQFVNQQRVSVGFDHRIYVADTGNDRIQVFDANGNFLYKIGRNGGDGTFGVGEGEFFYPGGVAAGPDGRIYVADTGNHRIQVFNSSGGFLFAFGEHGPGPGQFDAPVDVSVDEFGRVYVVDRRESFNFLGTADRIEIFTADGEFIGKFGEFGVTPGQFRAPSAIATGPNGELAVADMFNNRVQVFRDPAADVSLTKSGPATVAPGDRFAYRINLYNSGPATAKNVSVQDTLPPGVSFVQSFLQTFYCTEDNGVQSCGGNVDPSACVEVDSGLACNVGDLILDASATLDIVVDLDPTEQGTITNTASVSSTTSDPNLDNNTDTAVTDIVDVTPPVVTVPADVVAEATGLDGAIVSFSASAIDDSDGAITPACSPTSGAQFAFGDTLVTCMAADNAGNEGSASFTVSVVDTTPPALTVPLDLTEEANAVLSTVDIGTATASDIFAVTVTNNAPAAGFPVGVTDVIWTATDANGNVASATQQVTVVDTTPPVLTVPANVTAEANAVLSTVALGTATATDIFPVTVTSDAPATFPLGNTVVTWTATDANGNASTGTQTVTVVDTTPPVLTVPANVTAEANAVLSTVALGTATATDIFPVTVTSDAPATFPLGNTVVTWTATDANGNASTGTQTVTVVDTTPPALTVPADVTVTATGTLTSVNIGAASATDIFPVSISNNAPSAFPVGTTEVTWTATDANGNVATAAQQVHVVFSFGGFVAPVVQDGVYKAGRTLPVKIAAFYADGTLVPDLQATLSVQLLSSGVPSGDPLDVESTSAADSGTTFRLANDVYLFNLSTDSLSPGTYALVVDLHDGSDPKFIAIALK